MYDNTASKSGSDNPSRFPDEVPAGENKDLRHGAIVDVVKNEVETKPSQNPAKPHDTDSINTEFAKQMLSGEN